MESMKRTQEYQTAHPQKAKAEIEAILRSAMQGVRPEIGPELSHLLGLWAVWMTGRSASGPTGEWFVHFLSWALRGRAKAFVNWAAANPSEDSALAMKGIRQAYDFVWPHNASCGYIFFALWGWIQLELEKPGENRPPTIAEQMEGISRSLAAEGKQVKEWVSLGSGGIMGIPLEEEDPQSAESIGSEVCHSFVPTGQASSHKSTEDPGGPYRGGEHHSQDPSGIKTDSRVS